MANEIHFSYTTGLTLYAVRRDITGKVAVSAGSSWEAWGASSHDADDYDVTMTENGTGSSHYVGSFDASSNITDAGYYFVDIYKQVGGSPATGDPLVGIGIPIIWNGTSEVGNTNAAVAGGSANVYTVTTTGVQGGPAVPDVHCWVTTDSSGANIVASGITNDAGQVTFYLDVGLTYYVWKQKSGFTFGSQPETVVAT